MRVAVVAASLVSLAGCSRCSHGGPSTTEDLPDAPAASAAARGPAGSPDGFAVIAADGVGLVRIANGAVTTVHAADHAPGPLRLGPGGAIYGVAGDALVRIDAANETVLATAVYSADDIAVADDGTVYAALASGAVRFAGGRRTSLPALPDRRACRYVAVDARGVVYCSAPESKDRWAPSPASTLYRWSGELDASSAAWTAIDLPAGPSGLPGSYIGGLHRGLDGRLVVAMSGHFVTVGPDGVPAALAAPVDAGTTLFAMRGGLDADAFFWATPDSFIAHRDGSWSAVHLLEQATWQPTPAVDTLGRVWLAPKAGGFGVRDAEGTLSAWSPCSVLGDVLDVAVSGRGPAWPAQPPPPVRGPVRGRLTRKHKPAVGVTVSIASARALLGEPEVHGCELHASGRPVFGLPAAATATTDDEGRFVVEDVPRVGLGLAAFEADGKPLLSGALMTTACCRQMKDAGGIDLGTIELR